MCHIDPSQRVGTADPNAYRSWSLQSTRRRMGDRAGELLDPGPGANWQNGCQYREVSPRKNLAFPTEFRFCRRLCSLLVRARCRDFLSEHTEQSDRRLVVFTFGTGPTDSSELVAWTGS